MAFKPVEQKIDFPALERRILDWWYKSGIVKKYLHKNDSSKKNFSFIDGPITANNPMGVHHAWGRTYKDLWQKYFNMKGYRQRFQNGFDNQGLWVEVVVEKDLGFKSKRDIEKYGIENFVNKCKESTKHWAEVQTEQSKRLGFFMDWDNSYFTMSDENNYTIWHFLKKCFERGLLYKGHDSVPWCPRCGTAISQHEMLEEGYKELTHDSIYFELPVAGRKNERFLVWTTTPWTLPGNVALAVNPDFEYWLVTDFAGINFWVAGDLAKSVFGQNLKVVKKAKGSKLVGLKYTAAFDDLPAVRSAEKQNRKTFHSVVASKELVTASEGTGIVHIAPGCGTEDFALGKEEKLPIIAVIDEVANYLSGFGDLSGKNAKENPNLVLEHPLLKVKFGQPAADFIHAIKPYLHRYPVCWRCKEELVWRVVDEWYIKMYPLRESLKNSAKQARWIPEWGLDREVDWLNHMSDWLISKKRYWGLALPIWECKCGNFEVIGSKEEVKKRAVEGWKKFSGHSPHRPWIDEIKIKCLKCGKTVSRVKDVGNPWLDAGIVPFSTLIDPQTKKVSYLDDKKYWRQWFPADFITEGFSGQFRNWFYSILTMSTVLEGKAPFKTLLGHALVRDEKGEEMHKSKGNAVWFDDAAEKMGVDVMRWMYVTQNPVQNLNFGFGIGDQVRRKFHLMIWNIYNFFVTYANIDKWQEGRDHHKSPNVLDKWIMSRLNQLVKTVTNCLDNYDTANASQAIEEFVADLSNWYVRRSRDRIGPTAENGDDKDFCYATLHEVLAGLCRLLAPFTPFMAEEMYQNLTGEESVHLADWPSFAESEGQARLISNMDMVRKICELGHAARKIVGIKVRQPLFQFSIFNFPAFATALRQSVATRRQEATAGKQFSINNELVQLVKDELNIKQVVFKSGKGEIKVKLDTKITPELKAEGEVRDLTRQIQELRKKSNCRLNQKIRAYGSKWPTKEDLRDYIKKETLADDLLPGKELQIEPVE